MDIWVTETTDEFSHEFGAEVRDTAADMIGWRKSGLDNNRQLNHGWRERHNPTGRRSRDPKKNSHERRRWMNKD